MLNLKRKLLAVAMTLCIASVGAFAQRGQDEKHPKKDPPKVVVQPKDKPPPNNNRGDKDRGDKRGKP